jgi:hypothetical protein
MRSVRNEIRWYTLRGPPRLESGIWGAAQAKQLTMWAIGVGVFEESMAA